jgi:CheY-like chemotaxis protein
MESPLTNSLPCPSCTTGIEISTVQWCHCVSKTLSVVCPSCHACFCKLREFPMRAEWARALRGLAERQTAEKIRRAANSASASSPTALTVLVVDDDEEIRSIAEYTVQQMGYRTLAAANGEEALQIVEHSRPDIVLTDTLMPKIDGRQLCRLIKDIDRSIKVVVMTSLYTATRYRIEALSTFLADQYLAKPIDFVKLEQVLHQLAQEAA